MSNLSDKDIDRLSREAADFYEPDHTSLSWSRLEQKLIEQIPERPPDGIRFGRINPFVWGTAVIVIAGLSIFTIKNFNYSQHSTRTNKLATQGITNSVSGNTKLSTNTIPKNNLLTNNVVDSADRKKRDLALEASGEKNMAGTTIAEKASVGSYKQKRGIRSSNYNTLNQFKTKNESDFKSGKKRSDSKVSGYAVIAGTGLNAGIASRNSSFADTKTTYDNAGSKQTNNKTPLTNTGSDALASDDELNQMENSGKITARYSLPFVVSSIKSPGTIKGNDSLLNLSAHSATPIPYKSLRVNRSLNFGLSFGPDYTDAGGITNNQLGNNIGITLGYYITNKLSLNTGIFYSNKFFWAPGRKTGGSNIQPWTAAALPPIDYINGAANIWEIPFTLRYDFAQSEKTKFFLNAGLSSYLVVKQTYINFFYSGQRLLAYKTFDDEQVNYWFKVADISFGFETDLGKGFSFQAEPFFKLPLTTMGAENLKLNSYGFLLSFRYSPVLSRTKK